MPTYYYPSSFGAAEVTPTASAAGTKSFAANYQSPAGSYTVITNIPGTDPQQYTVTVGYTGPKTGLTFTATQTPYSDANHTETFATVEGAPTYLILTNGKIPADYKYTFPATSTPFVPTGGSTTDPTVCFASGTLIRTARGDVAVEHLAVGDLVVTASGEQRPIRWLGHRTLDVRHHLRPDEVAPIRIAAHALGPDRPSRDLLVSPGHAICVDLLGEVLIPASALVDGELITRTKVEQVIYWHVELDSHDIVLAENLPCESYLEMGNRSFFQDSGTIDIAASPDSSVRTHADFCRPYHAAGPVVDAVRAQIWARASANQKASRAAA